MPDKDLIRCITDLPAAKRVPVSINRDAELQQVITLMLMHDFSQLPVMQDERRVDGMISWRSITTAQVFNGTPKAVRDCLDKKFNTVRSTVRYDESLLNVVKTVMAEEIVLVVGQDQKVTGLLTVTDIGEQFIALAEPFLLLEQIENHIRAWLADCFTTEQLKAASNPLDINRKVETISDLSFGEYVRLLEKPENWQRSKSPLDRSTFTKRLDEVKHIRNGIMHFRPGGLSKKDLDVLRGASQFFYTISQSRK